MKAKRVSKKLGLNKETVANLERKGMKDIVGGKERTACTYCLYTCTGEPCTVIYCDTEVMSVCII